MEGLGRRFFFYLIGFGLGCVLVWAMFYRNSSRPAWLPEGRVLEFLEEHEVQISDDLNCKLDCYTIPHDFMNEAFWEAATVNFKESATERKPCPEYKITSTLADGNQLIIYVEACETEETATLRSVEDLSKKDKICACD